jgi:hypothetical protein
LSNEEEEESKRDAREIRRYVRAAQGLQEDDDAFSGLIHIGDVRERTRISIEDVYAHSYMRLLADKGGKEWEIWDRVANMEDTYFIAVDGEQRKEAILMKQTAQPQPSVSINQPLSLPQVETNRPLGEPQGQPQQKKHFWSRNKQ